MIDRHDLLSRMREALADLYDDPRSARRVVDDAGLDAARIERADRVVNFWHSILREAERQGKMDELLALAIKEYPARTDLAALREEYRTLSVARKEPPPTPREPEPAQPRAQTSERTLPRTPPRTIERVPKPAPRLSWLWLAAGLVIVAVVVVLATRRGTLNATPTNTNAVTALATRTLVPAAARPATDLPAAAAAPSVAPAAPSPASTAAPQAGLPECFEGYFGGVTSARVTTLEPGTNDFDLTGVDLKVAEPIGFMFTLNDQPIGAMRFRFVKANQFFRIESVVDSRCEKIEGYLNASRGGDKNVLQQWDTLQLTLDNQAYALQMGVWAPEDAPDKGLIRVDFGEPAPP